MTSAITDLAVNLGFAMIFLSIGLAFWRLVRGPSLPDRVVALDMMSIAIVAFCGLATVRYGMAAFLDVALVMALVAFLATVALARFAERQIRRKERSESQS